MLPTLTVCTSAWSALRDQVTTVHLLMIKLRHNTVWVLWISDRSAWTSFAKGKKAIKKKQQKNIQNQRRRDCVVTTWRRAGLLSYVMALCSLLSVSSGRIKCLCTPSPYLGEEVNDVVWSRNPYVTVSFILFAPSTTFLETTTEKMTRRQRMRRKDAAIWELKETSIVPRVFSPETRL